MTDTPSRPRVFNLAGSAESRARRRAEGMAVFLKMAAQAIDSTPEKCLDPEVIDYAAILESKPAKLAAVAKRFEIPPPGTINPTSPLRLSVIAKIAFPDGSMSVSALRRMGISGHLIIERIAGKDFTTLANIEEMRTSCRVKPTAPDCISKSVQVAPRSGSSGTPESPSKARAALKASLLRPRVPLRGISSKNTTPATSGEVIPMRSK
jgi:hypothetical protein